MSPKSFIGKNEAELLSSLQKRIGALRKQRGFTLDPERVTLLLVEEVGEIARQLKRTWSPNYESYSPDAMAEELADVLFVLLGLSDVLNIDIGDALKRKTASDHKREWKSIESPIPPKHSSETH